MIYIIGWIACFFVFMMQGKNPKQDRFLILLLLLLLLSFAFLRGNIGTDTPIYEKMFINFDKGYEWNGMEPGFVCLGWLLKTILPTVELSVRAVALIFFLLIAIFLIRSNQNERFLLTGYILPTFAYSYSMNGLRVGLASALLLIFIQLDRIRMQDANNFRSIIILLFAIIFHYSILYSIIFYILSRFSLFRVKVFLSFIFLIIIFTIAYEYINSVTYFYEKMIIYNDKIRPEKISGLSKFIIIVIFTIGLSVSNLHKTKKNDYIMSIVVFLSITWLLSQGNYAFLRFLDLLSFVFPVSIITTFKDLKMDSKMKKSIAIAGLFSSIFIFRSFYYYESESAAMGMWLPYEFIF